MRQSKRYAALLCSCLVASSAAPCIAQSATPPSATVPAGQQLEAAAACNDRSIGSPYIPMDSWVYPASLRLFSLGYGDSAFLGLRPWTRDSLRRALEEAPPRITTNGVDSSTPEGEAVDLYLSLMREAVAHPGVPCEISGTHVQMESAYTLIRGISGNNLRDSFHLGSSIVNDYGRPYGSGGNTYSGVSGYATHGRFAAYARAELQTTPTMQEYPAALATALLDLDTIRTVDPATGKPYVLATTPYGNTQSVKQLHLMEGYVSASVLNHVFSFGKVDQWMGPAQGAAMAYSTNADNVYAFQINRIEPLRIPYLSRLTGPFRYEFLVGPLQGHSYIPADSTHWVLPGAPWVHVEKINFKPTRNVEFGFSRTVIWGGKGHQAVNLKSFIRSFISTVNVPADEKNSDKDPGARFSSFDVTYRVPGLRNWLTFYMDSEVHDSVSPPSNPIIMAYRPGLYLAHVPRIPKLDIRVEGVNTDPKNWRSTAGSFMYWEYLQKQGYTNKGVLFGDWIGREGKGGQAWITYHLTPNEWVQTSYRRQKNANDFIAGGTTLDEVNAQVVKRFKRQWELNANFSFQKYQAPILHPGSQIVTVTNFQLTRFFK